MRNPMLCDSIEMKPEVAHLVDLALDEDLAFGPDITTQACVPANQHGQGKIVARQSGVIAGIPVAKLVAEKVAGLTGEQLKAVEQIADGTEVKPGDVVMVLSGQIRAMLTAERTMLNFLGQLSGVATATAKWVKALAGTSALVRDTRKTIPGMRILQKYAVACGGGVNHRMGLGDVALIKDNHVVAAGGIKQAFNQVKQKFPNTLVELECDTLDQVREGISAGAKLILLDNFGLAETKEAVEICSQARVKTEASGGLTLASAKAVAQTGVDYISVGGLTHSAKNFDLGLDM